MSNQNKKRLEMAHALRSAFREELMDETPTGQEISEMLVENGEDPDAVAKQYQSLVAEKIRAAKKERMLGFRLQNNESASFVLRGATSTKSRWLPDIDIMRSRIEALSSTPEFDRSNLAIAYRNGTKQSDSDISSLYQDLLDLGVIKDALKD